METPASLIDRLRCCADLWVEAKGASLAMLGRIVVNDGGYFGMVEASNSTRTATLEKFARFLADGANWPDGAVPEEAAVFAHVVGVSAGDGDASPGKADPISPQSAERPFTSAGRA